MTKPEQTESSGTKGAKAPGDCAGVNVELDFSTFVVSIGTSAMVGLGLAENPETGGKSVDLDMAKQNIDILAMLCNKTRGNLSGEEEKLLKTLLYDLRIAYVRHQKG